MYASSDRGIASKGEQMTRGTGKGKSTTSGTSYLERGSEKGELRTRETELLWLEENRRELVERYSGEWIVLEGERVLSHGLDAASVLNDARLRGISLPLLIRIPSKDEGRLALEADHV